MFLQQFIRAGTRERGLSGEQEVQHRAQIVDIAALVHGPPCGLLGADVLRGADDLTLDHRGHPKPSDLHHSGGVEHDIVGRDVTVDHSSFLGLRQSGADALEDVLGFGQAQWPTGGQHLQCAQRSVVRHDEELVVVDLAKVPDLDDVVGVQLDHLLQLAASALQIQRRGEHRGVHQQQLHLLPALVVGGHVDVAHPQAFGHLTQGVAAVDGTEGGVEWERGCRVGCCLFGGRGLLGGDLHRGLGSSITRFVGAPQPLVIHGVAEDRLGVGLGCFLRLFHGSTAESTERGVGRALLSALRTGKHHYLHLHMAWVEMP